MIDLQHLINNVKPIICWIKISEKAEFVLMFWSNMFLWCTVQSLGAKLQHKTNLDLNSGGHDELIVQTWVHVHMRDAPARGSIKATFDQRQMERCVNQLTK